MNIEWSKLWLCSKLEYPPPPQKKKKKNQQQTNNKTKHALPQLSSVTSSPDLLDRFGVDKKLVLRILLNQEVVIQPSTTLTPENSW